MNGPSSDIIETLMLDIKQLREDNKRLQVELAMAEWYRLPTEIRQRYWRETKYGIVPPSPQLKADIKKVLDEIGL